MPIQSFNVEGGSLFSRKEALVAGKSLTEVSSELRHLGMRGVASSQKATAAFGKGDVVEGIAHVTRGTMRLGGALSLSGLVVLAWGSKSLLELPENKKLFSMALQSLLKGALEFFHRPEKKLTIDEKVSKMMSELAAMPENLQPVERAVLTEEVMKKICISAENERKLWDGKKTVYIENFEGYPVALFMDPQSQRIFLSVSTKTPFEGNDKLVFAAFDLDSGEIRAFQRSKPEAPEVEASDVEFIFGREAYVASEMKGDPAFAAVYSTANIPKNEINPLGGVVQITDFFGLGHLGEHVSKFSAEERCRLMEEIVAAMERFHARGFSHGDINRLDNIMLVKDSSGNVNVKIIDFGNARHNKFRNQEAEVNSGKVNDIKLLGQTAFRLLTGENVAEEKFKVTTVWDEDKKMKKVPREILAEEPGNNNSVEHLIYSLLEGKVGSFAEFTEKWKKIPIEDRITFAEGNHSFL